MSDELTAAYAEFGRIGGAVGTWMAAAGGGSIINVSSCALMPRPRYGSCAGAKAALDALTTGAPEEIVITALYLASPASSYTTGSLTRVDGGLY